MRIIRRTSQFKQDVKRMQQQGKDPEKLKRVLECLVRGERLSPKCRDHVLVGQYKGTRECHLEPDWLLIYELTESELVLIRTGSHSDLFR
ncbi:MAG: type II toxin-antitoxin system YafQ family toxin [Anaerolineae bacterium]|jgi:mRNA interferase YafQ|nr:type II toxin-antitoxin system YafQ family toxin [Anaerolineae bacterium]MDH7474402.1 type II toxin-antitoxin system YafQ family toxin [Anaerolineae bacterium]